MVWKISLFFIVLSRFAFSDLPEGSYVVVGPPKNALNLTTSGFGYEVYKLFPHQHVPTLTVYRRVFRFSYPGPIYNVSVFEDGKEGVIVFKDPKGLLRWTQADGNGNLSTG